MLELFDIIPLELASKVGVDVTETRNQTGRLVRVWIKLWNAFLRAKTLCNVVAIWLTHVGN